MLRPLAASLACALVASPTPARQEGTPDLGALLARVQAGIVRVEYTPTHDKGQFPQNDHWRPWRYDDGSHAMRTAWEDWEDLILEERPAVRVGYLISPTRVYTEDPMLHPRFLEAIRVRAGTGVVEAAPAAYLADDQGWILELAAPLPSALPLEFQPDRPPPHFGITADRAEGVWAARIAPLRTDLVVAEDGRRFVPGAPMTLVVDATGGPVGISGRADRPADGAWKGSPGGRPAVSAAEMAGLLDALQAAADRALLRVTIAFRSPRSDAPDRSYGFRADGNDSITEWSGVGVLVADRTLLVLANLKPKVTARLERIHVALPGGREVAAAFAGSLRDYGALLVTLEESLPDPVRLHPAPVETLRNRLLLKAEIAVSGESRTAYFSRERIQGLYRSRRDRLYPSVVAERYETWLNFLFDPSGTLVALPVVPRARVTVEETWRTDSPVMTPAGMLALVLADPAGAIDPENRPLSEEEESRLAWLGVELQGMNEDLARMNGVLDRTNGGSSGGIVSYVYPGSPAASAGVRIGDILLRLHVEGQPRPLEVAVEESHGAMFDQFWSMLDQLPAEYLDQVTPPWGSAESTLARALTDLGFGTPFTVELFRDGQVHSVPLAVAEGPAHYASAPRFKSDPAGLTVRDLTYEVRRFYQLPDAEPAVVVSRIENGGKASVAGIRPFELITTVNDQPVTSAAEFERLLAAGGDLRLIVKRMATGRVVTLRIDPSGAR